MDAYAITDPDPSAQMLAKAIELALKDAGIAPDVIDCVHLHGTGTLKNAPANIWLSGKCLETVFQNFRYIQ
jgi:3-oxoacyl-[acyl-carrier-protein] synthase II